MKRSLKALNAKKVDMWYLHGPDRTGQRPTSIPCVKSITYTKKAASTSLLYRITRRVRWRRSARSVRHTDGSSPACIKASTTRSIGPSKLSCSPACGTTAWDTTHTTHSVTASSLEPLAKRRRLRRVRGLIRRSSRGRRTGPNTSRTNISNS